jgi:hypothetical protein
MYTYTFQPMDVQYRDSSSFIAMLILFFYAFMLLRYLSKDASSIYKHLHWAFAAVLLFPFYSLYNEQIKPPVQPKNIQVIGKLVSTQGEMVVNKSGKHSYSYNPVLLVSYAVPGGGVVTLRGMYGVVYPKEAILYAN